jgi:hypothetical protein
MVRVKLKESTMPKFITYTVVFLALCAIGTAFSVAGFTTSEVYQWREVVIFVSCAIYLTVVLLVHRLSGLGVSVIFVTMSACLSGLALTSPGLNDPVNTYPADFIFFIYALVGAFVGSVFAILLGVIAAHRYDRKKRGC